MRFVLFPVGTYGDVWQFVEIGLELARRGREVLLASAAPFRDLVESQGLEFAPILTRAEYERVLDDPDLWHARRFFRTYARGFMVGTAGRIVELAQEARDPTRQVLVAATSGSPGARIASELTGAANVSIWADPASIESPAAPPDISGFWSLRAVPRPLRRAAYRLLQGNADRILAPEVNALRRRCGLPPIRSVLRWMRGADLHLGLFPGWFAAPQDDWPAGIELLGFPRATLTAQGNDPALEPQTPSSLSQEELRRMVVVTFGTGMRHAAREFEIAARAVQGLGLHPLLISPQGTDLLPELPGISRAGFTDFSELLPQVHAIVHHGGVGTVAEALRCATPQFGVAFGHDQFDNVKRLRRLGVGSGCARRRLSAAGLRRALETMMHSAEVASACRNWAELAQAEDGVGSACDRLEQLGERAQRRPLR